jgi:hypothetical protein
LVRGLNDAVSTYREPDTIITEFLDKPGNYRDTNIRMADLKTNYNSAGYNAVKEVFSKWLLYIKGI